MQAKEVKMAAAEPPLGVAIKPEHVLFIVADRETPNANDIRSDLKSKYNYPSTIRVSHVNTVLKYLQKKTLVCISGTFNATRWKCTLAVAPELPMQNPPRVPVTAGVGAEELENVLFGIHAMTRDILYRYAKGKPPVAVPSDVTIIPYADLLNKMKPDP